MAEAVAVEAPVASAHLPGAAAAASAKAVAAAVSAAAVQARPASRTVPRPAAFPRASARPPPCPVGEIQLRQFQVRDQLRRLCLEFFLGLLLGFGLLLLHLLRRHDADGNRFRRAGVKRTDFADHDDQRDQRQMGDRRRCNVRPYDLPQFHRPTSGCQAGPSIRQPPLNPISARNRNRSAGPWGLPAQRSAPSHGRKARSRRSRCFPTAVRSARSAVSQRHSAAPASAGRPAPPSCDAPPDPRRASGRS